jgi:acetyl esterase/lipase
VLYLHGGGYVSGSPRTHRPLAGEIAHAAGARLLLPAYRLAPEHPFPAALEDAWVAYWWLLKQGVQPGQIVVAGDSAGGGLALALLVALRDAGLPLPAGLVCISPWVDLTLRGASLRANEGRDYLNAAAIRAVAALYLNGRDAREPLASPLFADLRGLPPTLIQTGTAELLLDDSKRLARRAAAAGVPVELELWENMVHVWHFLYLFEAKARQAIRRVGCFVRERVPAEGAAGAGPEKAIPWRA